MDEAAVALDRVAQQALRSQEVVEAQRAALELPAGRAVPAQPAAPAARGAAPAAPAAAAAAPVAAPSIPAQEPNAAVASIAIPTTSFASACPGSS